MLQQEQINLSLSQFTNILGWSPQSNNHFSRSVREPPLNQLLNRQLSEESSPLSLLDPSRPGTLRLHSLVVFLRSHAPVQSIFPREKRKFKNVFWNARLVWKFISWRQIQTSQEAVSFHPPLTSWVGT